MAELQNVSHYYSRTEVQNEIVKYCKGRWVGVHCGVKDKTERPILLRYTRRQRTPLTISRQQDISEILQTFRALSPRVIYSTANVYRSLEHYQDVADLKTVVACMPTWDINNVLDDWPMTILVAKAIVNFLQDAGIKRSMFAKWSGNGCHVHINHEAISKQMTAKTHPLELAYSAVRYTILSLEDEIRKIIGRNRLPKIENNMDPQRLFTGPLSLHRSLDVACVVFIGKT